MHRRSRRGLLHGLPLFGHEEEAPPSVLVVQAPAPEQQPYFPQQLAAQAQPAPGQFGGQAPTGPVIAVRRCDSAFFGMP